MATGAHKLSAEMLAACFAFLDMIDLISASHVCHFWRSVSLAFPALWAHISVDSRLAHPANIIHMAMSRAGCLAVDFEDLYYSDEIPDGLADAVTRYMDRLNTLKWAHDPSALDLTRPGPLLREFACKWLCVIPEEFLGGVAGNLRTLRIGSAIFPEKCPALDTVTYLDMAFPWCMKPDEITSFSRIFHLLPRLEVMHLRNLEGSPGSTLPLGPAPRTLREVSLQGWACDLFALYTAWALESVATVQLTKDIEELDVGPFISGAVEISVVYNRGPRPEMRTLAILPDGRQRTIVWSNVPKTWDAIYKIADAIRDTPVLPHMHTLVVPLSILGRALAGAWRWPSLTRLTVHIHDHEHELFTRGGDDGVRFLWAQLDCLRSVPALERLTLHVHT